MRETDLGVTLVDVAELSGVSIKTVSRVVNGEPNVAPATADRVRRAIEELEYVPYEPARTLSRGKVGVIGLVWGWSVQSLFSSTLVGNILRATSERGYNMLLFSTDSHPNEQVTRALRGRQVDGIILASAAARDNVLIRQLEMTDEPYVVIWADDVDNCKKASCVRIDDFAAARQGTEFLIGLGHRTIGAVSFRRDRSAIMAARQDGYRRALQEAGIRPENDLVFESAPPPTALGALAAQQLLSTRKDLTALFAFTDEIALGAISAIGRMGMKVPDDISVMGFSDTTLSSALNPPLTTIHEPLERISDLAVELIIDRIERPSSERVDLVLETSVAVRASCGPPRAGSRQG